MGELLLTLDEVQHRHLLPAHQLWKPWKKRRGAGILGLTLNLYSGSVLGLIGPNGAGKTTLLRMLAGILPLQSGRVIGRVGQEEEVEVDDLRTWVGHMPEQVRWQGRMSAREALEQLMEMRGGKNGHLPGLLKLVGLHQRADEPLDNLSQGMRQRLSIAAALLGSPKILVLDEPFNGLDPVAAQAFTVLIQRLAKRGVCIVISSHMVAQLEGLIDRIALIHRGQLLDEGPLEEVEKRLGLGGRYLISGIGQCDQVRLSEDTEAELLHFEQTNDSWHATVRGDTQGVLKNCLEHAYNLTSWAPVRPNLVEWLCAATGLSMDEISLEVSSSAILPLRTAEVGEDE